MSTDVHININITINKGAVILIFFLQNTNGINLNRRNVTQPQKYAFWLIDETNDIIFQAEREKKTDSE